MARVLVVSDLPHLRSEIRSMIESPAITVDELSDGAAVRGWVAKEECDLVITDLQIGSMGGMAVTIDLRHEESYGAAPHVPVLMLLDRRADVFLARRSGAEGFVVKPLDAVRVRRAVRALLQGEEYEDDAWQPATVRIAATPA